MIIICLLRELLITINLSFFEKQETIIAPLVGASQVCYRKNFEYRKNKKACHFFQASFLFILSGGRKGFLKIDQCNILGFIFSWNDKSNQLSTKCSLSTPCQS